jgi:hypothetical protein
MDVSAARVGPEPPLTAAVVADMLDALDAANVHRTAATLERLLATLQPAVTIRERLAAVDPATVRAALALRTERARSGQ